MLYMYIGSCITYEPVVMATIQSFSLPPPPVESDQYQLAVELGEKYKDFHVLVHLCESLGDTAKLQEYMTRYEAHGFSDFLFKQYLDQGKLKKLLSFSETFPAELSSFLKPHDSLSWLHHTATKEYGKVGTCTACWPCMLRWVV